MWNWFAPGWLAGFLLQPVLRDLTLADPITVAVSICLLIVVTLGAGLYPSIYLSRFRPARHMYSLASGRRGRWRSVPVILQYAIAVSLTLVTLIFYAQIHHIRDMNTGFERHQLVAMDSVTLHQQEQFSNRLQQELKQLPGIENVTMASGLPFGKMRAVRRVWRAEQGAEATILDFLSVGARFFDTLSVTLLSGRTLSDTQAMDILQTSGSDALTSVVLNETAARSLGLDSQEAIGERLVMSAGGRDLDLVIVGVVSDIQWFSARNEIFPTIYVRDQSALRHMLIRTNPAASAKLLDEINRLWTKLSPDIPLQLVQVEERYNQLYEAEARQIRLFAGFTFLIVITAALGLYGLASFEAKTRAKEIGIRKALGARSADILLLMIWQFSRPMIIASFIAVPLVVYLIDFWLSGFVQRVALTPIPVLGTVLGVLFVAWAAISGQVVRAACKNPSLVLRELD